MTAAGTPQPRSPAFDFASARGWYNGYSPEDRNGALAAIRAAIARGELSIPDRCSVCQCAPERLLGWHSERYDVLDAYPICWGCHVRLHSRFRHPDRWRAFVAQHRPDGWFQKLTLDPLSLVRPFDETYPAGLPTAEPAQDQVAA